jgi:hypothetical protein
VFKIDVILCEEPSRIVNAAVYRQSDLSCSWAAETHSQVYAHLRGNSSSLHIEIVFSLLLGLLLPEFDQYLIDSSFHWQSQRQRHQPFYVHVTLLTQYTFNSWYIFLPPIQNTVRISKQIAILILYQVISGLGTLLGLIYSLT